jgi:regulator of protease activity HflC (stomatin/prohibitin superfamily)
VPYSELADGIPPARPAPRESTMTRNSSPHQDPTIERPIGTWNGFAVLALGVVLLAGAAWQLWSMVGLGRPSLGGIAVAIALVLAAVLVLAGLYTLQPNEAAILQLFGAYRGTSRVPGLRATNPFYTRKKISLRARNLNGERLKVNDKRGNPIEIAAVVVWHVEDTAKATFDVDDYENFVKVQSEAAVRHLASSFAYDEDETAGGHREPTLLGSADIVAKALERELQARLDQAGVVVEEARLTHLAYAPEIAQVMLRRQQAEAIIAARQKIVHGAVSMVEMALSELSAKQVVTLDDERKASMVSNLMTVLCAESEVQPVINTGTLYG